MLLSIFNPKDLSNVRSISHGKNKKKIKKSAPNFTVFDVGLAIHSSFPFLVASLDGKVFDPSSDDNFGLLEIKCPFAKRNETLDQAAEDETFSLKKTDEEIFLKKIHPY